MKDQFKQMISASKHKIKKTESTLNIRNFYNQSYQQYQFLNLQSKIDMFFNTIENLAEKGHVNVQVFNKMLQNPTKYSTTLITFCQSIENILVGQNQIRISHQHYNSQIVILAFFLRYSHPEKNIILFTSELSLKGWYKYFIDDKSTDPETDLKSLLSKQRIKFAYFNEFNKDSLNNITSEKDIVIFDLMNTQFTKYQPIFLSFKDKLNKFQKTIIYNSNDQQQQVDYLLSKSKCEDEFYACEASMCYPIEIQHTPKDSDIKKHLIDFLKQDSSHPQKQDIIIFYKNQHLLNSTQKRFISKLKQLFSQQSLLPSIQLIISKNEIIQPGKNHIFITQNTQQLIQWNYDYNEVFYVIDYGWNVTYRMDSENYCYVEGLNKEDLIEKNRRINFVGLNKVGKYVYKEDDIIESFNQYDKATEVMSYLLKIIDFGLSSFIQKDNKRILACLKSLEESKIIALTQNGQYKVIDEEILNYCYQGIDPIQAKIIRHCIETEKDKQQKTLTNLLFYSFAIFSTKGNLRQTRDVASKSVIKPTGVWRRTGYLHSCLEILTKAQLIEAGKNCTRSYSRKRTKNNQIEEQVFGNLFEIIAPKKIQFEDMKLQDLIRQYYVNEEVFSEIREKTDSMREIFNIEQTNIKIDQNKNQLIQEVIQKISHLIPNSIAMYSGSRRSGYFYNSALEKAKNIFPNRDSLISQLNEVPPFMLILRCSEFEGKKQILMCNSVSVESYLSIFGELPTKNTKSSVQFQIQFHGVSSAVFKGLYRNNSFEIKKFQEQHSCNVQPNQQISAITICCKKQNQDKIKQSFDQLINKIKQKYINYDKIIHYLGNTNLRLSNGGQIKQVIKNNYINRCYLNNLDLEVTQQDLQQLFDQFFVLKQIQILATQPNKFSKSAIITFNSQKDYYRFYSYYNECKYMDRLMDVKPILMKTEALNIQSEMYIMFKWYVWKSHKRAIVFFKEEESANKAFKALSENPKFDGNLVKFQLDKNKLIFNDLHQTVDEIFLEKGFLIYGDIIEVEILKTPIKQPSNPQSLLDVEIRNALKIVGNMDVEDRYKIDKLQKHKNGLRTCKVTVKRIEDLNNLINSLNEVKRKNIGQGRLYAESWFTKPIPIVYTSTVNLYIQLLHETINEAPPKPNIQYSIKDLGQNQNRMYIILKSPLNQTLEYISKQFQIKLLPNKVDLTSFQKDIIITDIGIDNIIDVQEKYLCKLVVNSVKKQLQVICLTKDLKQIRQEITARVEDKFFYRITLNNKSYKKLANDKEKLESIKQTYFLTVLEIQDFSKTLLFEGSAHHVQNALNYMMHLIESFTVPQEELVNSQFCMICYTECTQPYRLQNCSHKFCFSCLDQYINSTLGDISMFPIKCPHCMIQLTIDDLQSLVDKGSWPKLINMAANQFVGLNAENMTFCFTAGCKQINLINLHNFKCDLCAQSYCCECKQHNHPNLTCEQAKAGSDQLFKKYMQQNGVRICPNKSCKMPIIRTDGCYRVTCSRCNKSMCFKCDPDKMIAYNDYNECYKHLNDVHGGYW